MAIPSVLEQLAKYQPADRPGAVVQAIRQLSMRTARDLVLISRLTWEAHEQSYWSKVVRQDGTPYLDENSFLEDVLGLESWRTALKRIALGRAIAALPEGERDHAAEELANLGAVKATILTPMLEADPKSVGAWVKRAQDVSARDLQQQISDELGARPRGPVQGDRVAAFIRNMMPDPETRELFDQFLKVGRTYVETESTIGVFIAAMQELVADWSARVHGGARRG